MSLVPASGTGLYYYRAAKVLRLVRYGCSNRPFYHITVTERRRYQYQACIEQLGSFDPMPNQYNEKLVSLNVDRLKHWLGKGATISKPVAEVLGLSGYLPIHPQTYMRAWRKRSLDSAAQVEPPKEEVAA